MPGGGGLHHIPAEDGFMCFAVTYKRTCRYSLCMRDVDIQSSKLSGGDAFICTYMEFRGFCGVLKA